MAGEICEERWRDVCEIIFWDKLNNIAQHRCVTPLYRIPLGNFYCSGEDLFRTKQITFQKVIDEIIFHFLKNIRMSKASDNHDLNYYFNAKNIPNQDLVFDTYNFFNKGAGKKIFDPLSFLNLLNWHYNFLVTNIELPFDILEQLNSLKLSKLELQTLRGFLLKWFGGYPVNNLNTQFNTVLKLIEEEYLDLLKANADDPLNLDNIYSYLQELDSVISNISAKSSKKQDSLNGKKFTDDINSTVSPNEISPSIFISHSSKDLEIVKFFCDKILFLSLHINPENIFCTTIEAFSIKTGDDFRKVIREKLIKASIVIQIITKNYKESEVCLNEMGAAWVLNNKVIPFIVNPIGYNSVGFIHGSHQILKLEEQKDILKFIDEMGVPKDNLHITEIIRHVDDFTSFINQENKIQAIPKIEIEAMYNGNWHNYLKENLNEDVPANNGAPKGKYIVIVRFIINTHGEVTDAIAITNHGYGMEQEALRVIRNSPNWKSAVQNGKPVNAYRKQPITFLVD